MLFSRNRYHRQVEQSDKHLIVNGPTNLMVDSRGVVRPFGIGQPPAGPSAKPLDKQGVLRRDISYSYLYTYFDSYNNVESEPSPCTDFVGLAKVGSFSLVGFGSVGDSVSFSKLIITGDLEKEDDYYKNQSIAVNVVNNDRKTEYSQWQYRKIVGYKWDAEQNAGIFTLSRPLINVDTDPEDRNYEVKLSDIECEEGVVGGKAAGKSKLILDPSASTDIASYRLKLIRITAGKGKGQARIIADACLNPSGLVEITLAKPWKVKPKFVDDNLPEVQKAQSEWQAKERLPISYFNRWFSSEYMIYDPMRHSGLAIDGAVTSYDKKTGLVTIDGLGNGSAILSGNVIRFVQKTEKKQEGGTTVERSSSSLVVTLENSNTADDWVESDGLIDKTIRITSGPGSGATFVISAVEKSGENSISLTLSSANYADYNSEAFSLTGTPNAASTFVIFSDDPISSPSLTIGAVSSKSEGTLYRNSDADTSYSKDSSGIYYIGDSANFIPYSEWNNDNDKTGKLSLSYPGATVYLFEPKKTVGIVVRDPAAVSAIASLFPDPTVADPSIEIDLILSFANGSPDVSFRAALPSHGYVSYHSPYYAVLFFNNIGTDGKSNFKKLLTKNSKYIGDDAWSISLASLYNHGDDSTKTADPPDSDIDPGFKIYVSSLSDLGLSPDSLVSGAYSLTFTVSPRIPEDIIPGNPDKATKKYSYRITRPILSVGDSSPDGSLAPYVVVSGALPVLYLDPKQEPHQLFPLHGAAATVIGNSLMEGFYTGWKAFFYNDDLEAKPKQKFKEARVAGYFDASGSLLLDTKLSGVGPGWSCVLFSEYSRCLGTAIAPYDSDAFYAKKSVPIKAYYDYVPLEAFAASENNPEDDTVPYEGWTVQVLSSSKRRKNGTSKYKAISSKKAEKRKRTIVKYFPTSRRAYVFYKEEDASFPADVSQYFKPQLDGSEHLWLYDESSAVDTLFNEDSDSSVEKDTSEYGCRIQVTDIRPCPYAGVDKIRLYRATEITNAYHLVATLDNKLQTYEDNTPEDYLRKEIDFSTTVLPPAGVCCYYKGHFAVGGVPDGTNLSAETGDNPVITPILSSFYALFPFDYDNPVFDGYSYSNGGTFNSTIIKSVPAFSTPVNASVNYSFPVSDKLKAEKLNVSFLISEPSSDGLIAYALQDILSGRTQPMPVVHFTVPPTDSDSPLVSSYSSGSDDHSEIQPDRVYLPRSASSLNDAYLGCRLTITAPGDDKKPFVVLLGTGDYTGVTRCLDHVDYASFYTLPEGAKRYPSFPFSLDRILWSVKRKTNSSGVSYVYSDAFGNESFLEPISVSGPNGSKYLSFGFTVNQGTDFSAIHFGLGGKFLEDSIESSNFSLVAFSFSDTNDALIESYLPSLGKLLEERSAAGLVMQIPGLVSNFTNASIFTDDDSTPFARTGIVDGDDFWRIAVFDKYNSPYNTNPGPITVFPRSNGYLVHVCSSGDPTASEKVELASVFTFADEFGDRITGLVPRQKFILVFKERAIYALDPDEPSTNLLNSEVGCIAPDSIASGRSGVYWLSADRRILRSSFTGDTIYYASKEIQPWLDGNPAFGDELFDETRIREVKATYDADTDEYMIAFPTKSGKLLLFAFSDSAQTWFRIVDHSGTSELCSENAFNCLFKNHGRASFASDHGVYSYSEGYRSGGFYPWKYASTYLSESNEGLRKHVKRIQVINLIDKNLPASPVPCAYFEFFRDLLDTPEESYQNEDRHTRRFFDTNKFVQFVHVGLRSLLWNFVMSSSDQDKVSYANFVRIHDFTLHYRNKREDDPRWNATPYTDPPIRTN